MSVRAILVIGNAIAFVILIIFTKTSWHLVVEDEYVPLLIILPSMVVLFLNFFYIATIPINHGIGDILRPFIKAWKEVWYAGASKDE